MVADTPTPLVPNVTDAVGWVILPEHVQKHREVMVVMVEAMVAMEEEHGKL